MLGIKRKRPPDASPTEVPNNPELSAHLEALRAKGSASSEELERIRELAGNLSFTEANAIRATLKELERVPEKARADLDQYMWDQVEKRSEHVEHAKRRNDLVG